MNSTMLKIITSTICNTFNKTTTLCSETKEKIDIYRHWAASLSQGMGLQYQLTFETGRDVLLPNGTWTGMTGMVNRSEADLAISRLMVTVERSKIVTFSYPFIIEDCTFATRMPEYSPETFAVLRPFSLVVWLATIASMTFMASVYYVLFKNRFEFSGVAFEVMATVLRQSTSIKSETTGKRLAIFTWTIASMVLTTCYVSVLLSVLTIPVLTGVRTIPELAEAVLKGEYRCMSYYQSILARKLSDSTSEDARIIGDCVQNDPDGYGTIEAFMKAKGKVAYLGCTEELRVLRGRYFISADSFLQLVEAFAARQDFPYRRRMDRVIHRMSEAGIFLKGLRHQSHFTLLKTVALIGDSQNSPRRLSVRDVAGAFIFLLCGYCLAMAALMAEVVLRKLERR